MVKESEIFYGFCMNFSALGINAKPTPSIWKYRIYYYFDLLGRMLGYEVFTEDTFRETDKIPNVTGKRIDMTWASPTSNSYVLAFEYENSRDIDDEVAKLTSVTGLRVLVIFRNKYTDKEIIDKIVQKQAKDDPENTNFLVFVLPDSFMEKEPFEKLATWLFDPKGRIIAFGSAEGYVGWDGLCSFRRITWQEI